WGGANNQEPFALNTGGRYCAQSGVTPTPTPTATASATCLPSWIVVNSPNANEIQSELDAVTGGGNDVWAVGSYDLFGLGEYRTLTIHWDGSAWSLIPSPNPGMEPGRALLEGIPPNEAHDYLFGATGQGNDVWAVGAYNAAGQILRTLTLHWNGSAWSQAPSPNAGTSENSLWGATGSGNDVWAVGYSGGGNNPSQTLTLHWNGAAWTIVPSPNFGTNSRLYAITGGGNDVWAVGMSYDSNFNTQTFTLHWDGITWSVMPSPNVGEHT